MVGGSYKREDALPAITSNNIFSALESRRRKSGKKRLDKASSLKELNIAAAVPAPPIWTPKPVQVKSWADCEEDDDDYFAMPVLPPISDPKLDAVMEASQPELSEGEESEGDEEAGEPEEDAEEDYVTEEIEAPAELKVAPAAAPAPREPDKQLSRKELKKKELAELDAVLAELGLTPKEEKDVTELVTVKTVDVNGEIGAQSAAVAEASEVKVPKKRKSKKDKSAKEGKDEGGALDAKDTLVKEEDAVESFDPKDIMKKLASMKKKKSFKENDSSAKAAVAEASARAAKLAAAKKKEKNHYNQQPVR